MLTENVHGLAGPKIITCCLHLRIQLRGSKGKGIYIFLPLMGTLVERE